MFPAVLFSFLSHFLCTKKFAIFPVRYRHGQHGVSSATLVDIELQNL